MPSPCKRCRDRGLECLVDVCSGRCQNCVASHKSCDLLVTLAEFNKMAAAKEKLQRQVREAEEHLEEVEEQALEQIRTARAKVRRLRKQLHRVDDKERAAISSEAERIVEAEAEEEASALLAPGDRRFQLRGGSSRGLSIESGRSETSTPRHSSTGRKESSMASATSRSSSSCATASSVRRSARRSCLRRRTFFILRRTSSSSISSISRRRLSRVSRSFSHCGSVTVTSHLYPLRTHSEHRPERGPTIQRGLEPSGPRRDDLQ